MITPLAIACMLNIDIRTAKIKTTAKADFLVSIIAQ
jgi:hypothetical protein